MANLPIRLCFLIRSLDCGGSQRQLAELVRSLDRTRFTITVLTFYPGGLFWNELRKTPGVNLVCLDKAGRWDVAAFGARLVNLLRRSRPDIVHGYGVVSNELAWLGGRAAGARVVWGLRASNLEVRRYHWTVGASLAASARLSRRVDLVIANSRAGMAHHLERGFHPHNLTVVPNGIDTDRFRPLPEAREALRREWAVRESEFLIGMVGRLDPMKDHATFLEAMTHLARRHPDVRVVCVGDSPSGIRRYRAESRHAPSLGARLRWEPARPDVERVLAALDALVLPSAYGEGFPNVVGEAMAAEVPCIVTDAGDAAMVLDDRRRTVPPADPPRLLDACERLLSQSTAERRRTGRADRRRIVGHFGTAQLARRTGRLLETVAARGPSSAFPSLTTPDRIRSSGCADRRRRPPG